MTDALFDPPTPEHPDAAIAREEITRYCEEQVAEAARALVEAQAALDARTAALAAWRKDRTITPDPCGQTDMAPSVIADASIGRYMAAELTGGAR